MNLPIEKISEIISTRISHDMVGNIGAVSNAVELLEEGDMDFLSDIKSILKVSSSVLSARMKFFRLSFGLGNSDLKDTAKVREISQNCLNTLGNAKQSPIKLEAHLQENGLNREAMLTIMSLADTIIKGGKIEIETAQNSIAAVVSSEYTLSEEKINTMKEILKGNLPENLSLYAPFIYLATRVQGKGKKIELKDMEGLAVLIR